MVGSQPGSVNFPWATKIHYTELATYHFPPSIFHLSMMNVCPVRNPVPVIVLPTSASSAWSRNALPPTRRKMCCPPALLRRTTARRSLFEPVATGARNTVPVICCLVAISPSEVLGDLRDPVIVGVRHQYMGLRQDLALFLCRRQPVL